MIRGNMDKNTLYVTDLDGTLLRSDATLSPYTISTINRLTEQGLAFTYATARSIESARPIAGELNLRLPAIDAFLPVFQNTLCGFRSPLICGEGSISRAMPHHCASFALNAFRASS